jgi:hypothetical protein
VKIMRLNLFSERNFRDLLLRFWIVPVFVLCGTIPSLAQDTAPAPAPQRKRTQFMINVQVVTTTSVDMPGAITAQSQRSMNQGSGVSIPLTIHDDGTFEGSGSGSDAGTAFGVTRDEEVNSQFQHDVSMQATGVIHPGNCATPPCQPDMMHLELTGTGSPQNTNAQARGTVNRDYGQVTPGGKAIMEFDLPAYVGSSAEQVLMATGFINSKMTVTITAETITDPPTPPEQEPPVPPGLPLLGSNGGDGSGSGSGSGGGAAGGGAGAGSGGGSSGGATGIVIPGLEGGCKKKNTNSTGVVMPGSESTCEQPHVAVAVDETIHTADTIIPPLAHVTLTVNEVIHTTDGVSH